MADRTEALDRGTTRDVILTSMGFGLIAGLLEVAVLVIQQAVDPKVTVESIRTNHHYPWMIPISAVAIFTALGLMLGVVGLRWPRFASRAAPLLLGVPMFLGPLMAVRGLYPVVCFLLAVGLAVRLTPWVRLECPRFRRLARTVVPILLVVVAMVGWIRTQILLADVRSPAVSVTRPSNAHRTPNVLLIVMDTVRADHLSLYGYGRATTPNLDRWAKRGVVFTGARATAPWTLPSHASLLTGRWPHELSADVDHPLDDEFPTLAEVLRKKGYATGGFVANTYYCNAWYGLDRGFSRYEDFPENVKISSGEILRSSTLGKKLVKKAGFEDEKPGAKGSRKSAASINRRMLDWISQQGSQPFFAFLNYYDAHGPFEPPTDHTWRFGDGVTNPSARIATFRQLHDRRASDAPGGGDLDAAESKTPAGPGVEKTLEHLVDAYDECIASIDEQLGALLEELNRRGILDETLVVITSDHGEHFGDRGLFGHGHSLYSPLIDVPLLILPPRGPLGGQVSPDGLRVSEPVSLRDFPATVAGVLGLRAESPFPGQSLDRFWLTNAPVANQFADPPLSEVEHQKKFPPSSHVPASTGPLWSLVEGKLVYIRDSEGREQLYDRATDPGETRNLAEGAARSADLERLRDALNRLLVPEQDKNDPDGP